MDKKTTSVLEMAGGAIMEKFEYEVSKVIDNIQDINTDPEKKRTVTLTVDFKPSSERQVISISVQAKSKLQPVEATDTAVIIAADENGERVLQEWGARAPLPGQIDLEGGEQPENKIMRLAAKA